MQVLIILVVCIVAQTFAYHQDDYNLTSDHMEVKVFDKSYSYITVKIANFKYNRTVKALNVTFSLKQDMANNVTFNIQGYRFTSNEYRLFPMTFSNNICEVLEKDEFGMQNVYQCGNFTGCPLAKGDYFFCNWIPDPSKFPPHVPSGKYMMDLKAMYSAAEIAHIQWYIMVEKRMTWSL